MAADRGDIAAGAVAAAIGATPDRPRLTDRRRRSWFFGHRGERALRWGVVVLGRKTTERPDRLTRPTDPAAAIDEGIEHQVEELVGELEGDFLRAGRGFAGKPVQRCGEIVAGEVEERHEGRRQRASIVEEVVDGMADVKLVDGEDRQRRRRRRCDGSPDIGGSPGIGGSGVAVAWRRRRRCSGTSWAQEVEHCGIVRIAQARLEVGPQAGGGESVERAGRPPRSSKWGSCAPI